MPTRWRWASADSRGSIYKMFREMLKHERKRAAPWDSRAWESAMGRVGLVTSVNGNGTYGLVVDGASFSNVPSYGGPHTPGQTVRVVMERGQPVIVS